MSKSSWKNQTRLYVIPYRGWGNSREWHFTGAVVRGKGIVQPLRGNSVWSNSKASARRFLSSGVPGQQVQVRFYGRTLHAITDERGIFSATMSLEGIALEDTIWHPYTISVPDKQQGIVVATGMAMISGFRRSRFGIISDIDDTFMITYATQKFRRVLETFFRNAATRKPFSGVGTFYQALHNSAYEGGVNPFFFVSSSAWNLYDMLIDFCYLNNIPQGPMLLHQRHYQGLRVWKARLKNHDHKLVKARQIVQTYPQLPFVLIGDSGQADTSIYSRLYREFPEHIRMIYIRNVSGLGQAGRLREKARQMGVPENKLFFARQSYRLQRHAHLNGLI